MKKIIFLNLFITLLFIQTKAQECQANYEEIVSLKSQTIKVVLNPDDDTSHYNEAIKAALEKYWTYSKYEFVSLDYYETNCIDMSMVFLIPLCIMQNCAVNELSIINGQSKPLYSGRYNTFYLYSEPVLLARANILSSDWYPELYRKTPKPNPNMVYSNKYPNDYMKYRPNGNIMAGYYSAKNKEILKMLPNIIQQWQWENETIASHPELAGKKPEEVTAFLTAQHDIKQLKEKILLIDENSFSKLTEEKIAEVYKYKFKLVSPEEIVKAIANQDENICYLYNGSKACDCSYPIIVYQAKGGYRLYAPKDYHQVTMYGGGQASFSDKYLEGLMEAIDK